MNHLYFSFGIKLGFYVGSLSSIKDVSEGLQQRYLLAYNQIITVPPIKSMRFLIYYEFIDDSMSMMAFFCNNAGVPGYLFREMLSLCPSSNAEDERHHAHAVNNKIKSCLVWTKQAGSTSTHNLLCSF